MFSSALHHVFQSVDKLHSKHIESDPQKRPPHKLLHLVGKKGSGKEEFLYPRGVATDSNGDVIVADTMNHRLQRYHARVYTYKDSFGLKGERTGQFQKPTDVTVLDNDDIVVADSGNCRVQIYHRDLTLKKVFKTKNKLFYIACDGASNIYCSTVCRMVETYNQEGQLVSSFPVVAELPDTEASPLPIQVSKANEIIICDTPENHVRFYSLSGEMLRCFQPYTDYSTLWFQMSAVALNPDGDVLVADALNHVVNVFNPNGDFIAQLLRPTDDAGSIQAMTVTPEGHLAVLEHSANGPHNLKIYRYLGCSCHNAKVTYCKKDSSQK